MIMVKSMKSVYDKEWTDFKLGLLAEVKSGRDIYAQDRIDGETPYVTAGTANNGIGYFVGNDNDAKDRNIISVNRNGAVGEAFYHPYTALFGNDCRRVSMRSTSDSNAQLFIAESISHQKSAFSYSRKLGTARLNNLHFMLPVSSVGEPDYEYMAKYSKEKQKELLYRYKRFIQNIIAGINYKEVPSVNNKKWIDVSLDDLFIVKPGKRLETRNKVYGDCPFIGASDKGNGVTGFVGNKNTSIDANVLGVNYNGAPCIAFYHPYECIFSDDVKRLHLRGHEDNKFIYLFFATIFAQQKSKYSYGYKFNEQRMLRQKLMVPVNDKGKIDFEYMEQYAKNMMLKKYKQYLSYIKRKELL